MYFQFLLFCRLVSLCRGECLNLNPIFNNLSIGYNDTILKYVDISQSGNDYLVSLRLAIVPGGIQLSRDFGVTVEHYALTFIWDDILVLSGGFRERMVTIDTMERNFSRETYFLHVGNSTWERGPMLIQKRGKHATAFWSGSLFVCGGTDGIEPTLRSCESYNKGSDKFIQSIDMIEPRKTFALVNFDDTLCAFGGDSSILAECISETPPTRLDSRTGSTWAEYKYEVVKRSSKWGPITKWTIVNKVFVFCHKYWYYDDDMGYTNVDECWHVKINQKKTEKRLKGNSFKTEPRDRTDPDLGSHCRNLFFDPKSNFILCASTGSVLLVTDFVDLLEKEPDEEITVESVEYNFGNPLLMESVKLCETGAKTNQTNATIDTIEISTTTSTHKSVLVSVSTNVTSAVIVKTKSSSLTSSTRGEIAKLKRDTIDSEETPLKPEMIAFLIIASLILIMLIVLVIGGTMIRHRFEHKLLNEQEMLLKHAVQRLETIESYHQPLAKWVLTSIKSENLVDGGALRTIVKQPFGSFFYTRKLKLEKTCGFEIELINSCKHSDIPLFKHNKVEKAFSNGIHLHGSVIQDVYKRPIIVVMEPQPSEYSQFYALLDEIAVASVIRLTKCPSSEPNSFFSKISHSSHALEHKELKWYENQTVNEWKCSQIHKECKHFGLSVQLNLTKGNVSTSEVNGTGVQVFCLCNWNSINNIPIEAICELIYLVKGIQRGGDTLVLMCETGVDKSMIFMLAVLSIQLLEEFKVVNILGLLNVLRQMRCGSFTKQSSQKQLSITINVITSYLRQFRSDLL